MISKNIDIEEVALMDIIIVVIKKLEDGDTELVREEKYK